MSPVAPQFFQALPAFFGGKRRLAPLILALVASARPRERWPDTRFFDPMCGGGSVALLAKAQDMHVTAGDAALRSVVIARALIANSRVRLRRGDILTVLAASASGPASAFVPGVFSAEQAAVINQLLHTAQQRAEPQRSLLRLLTIKLALRCQPMSMLRGTDARAAAGGDYDAVSPARVGHYLRSERLLTIDGLWGLAQEINGGVIGGQGSAVHGDVLQILHTIAADVVYLDPPYPGTSSYLTEYRVLDALLDDTPSIGAALSLDALLDAAAAIPVLVLSYGGPSLTLAEVEAAVARHRRVERALAIPYRHLGALASAEKNATNREFLVLGVRP